MKRPRQRSGTLFDEWGSLDFLNQLEETRKFVPTLLGVDVKGELSVMEDLGESKPQQLSWILKGEDPALAECDFWLLRERWAGFKEQHPAGRWSSGNVGGVFRHRVHRIAGALEDLPDRLHHAVAQGVCRPRGVMNSA